MAACRKRSRHGIPARSLFFMLTLTNHGFAASVNRRLGSRFRFTPPREGAATRD
ncbi:hypothetical protein EM6_2140 [Asticcacaulis excentricus]|uniref:Uncharacterized protein n=1 Tax=Asticcacaulis excentricus TaxID=78587 RepID=A0A3G9GAM3_9CAUL|nr:hypothetical protein EM6_2140 [Asticcacaulis excentricus]